MCSLLHYRAGTSSTIAACLTCNNLQGHAQARHAQHIAAASLPPTVTCTPQLAGIIQCSKQLACHEDMYIHPRQGCKTCDAVKQAGSSAVSSRPLWLTCTPGTAKQPLQAGTSSMLQLASLAHMHIKLHICEIGQPARGIIVPLNQGCQRLQSVLDVLACTQHRSDTSRSASAAN